MLVRRRTGGGSCPPLVEVETFQPRKRTGNTQRVSRVPGLRLAGATSFSAVPTGVLTLGFKILYNRTPHHPSNLSLSLSCSFAPLVMSAFQLLLQHTMPTAASEPLHLLLALPYAQNVLPPAYFHPPLLQMRLQVLLKPSIGAKIAPNPTLSPTPASIAFNFIELP